MPPEKKYETLYSGTYSGIFLPLISPKNQCNEPYIRHRMEFQNEVIYRLETAPRSDLFEERDDQERYKSGYLGVIRVPMIH